MATTKDEGKIAKPFKKISHCFRSHPSKSNISLAIKYHLSSLVFVVSDKRRAHEDCQVYVYLYAIARCFCMYIYEFVGILLILLCSQTFSLHTNHRSSSLIHSLTHTQAHTILISFYVRMFACLHPFQHVYRFLFYICVYIRIDADGSVCV